MTIITILTKAAIVVVVVAAELGYCLLQTPAIVMMVVRPVV
jgi:hypothetical protein